MSFAPFRQPRFTLLWVAGLVSLTGDWLLAVALPIAVYRLTGSVAATSALVAVNVVPRLLFGAVAGVYVDRWDRRRVLVTANVLQAATLLPLLMVTSGDRVWPVYGVVLVQAALSQLVRPAEHALLPHLVDQSQLASANALNTLNNNLARLVGPAAGGLAAVTLGLRGVVLLDAASFLVAAALVALVRGSYRAGTAQLAQKQLTQEQPTQERLAEEQLAEGARRGWGRFRHELAEGVTVIWRAPLLRVLFVVLAVASIGEGIMGSLFPVFVDRALGGGPGEIGALMSAQAVGGLVGGLLCAWVARRLSPVWMVGTGLVLFGAVDVVIFNYPRWSTALAGEVALFVLVGIPGAVLVAGAMTLVQTEVADELRGRVFATAGVVEAAARLPGAALAAALTDRLGVVTVLTAQGLAYVVAGVAFAVLVRRSRPMPPAPPPRPEPVGARQYE